MHKYFTPVGWAVALGIPFLAGFLTGAGFFLYAHHTALEIMGR